jgi:hypothetical protein
VKKKAQRDIKGVISCEKRYSTLAKQEGQYAKKAATSEKKRGLTEMAKDSKHEAKVAFEFAKKRRTIVSKEQKKLKGSK